MGYSFYTIYFFIRFCFTKRERNNHKNSGRLEGLRKVAILGVMVVEEKLLCNFLTIIIYGIVSIYILRKRSTFELTPSFLLENLLFYSKTLVIELFMLKSRIFSGLADAYYLCNIVTFINRCFSRHID
jgi:hypothetical protein